MVVLSRAAIVIGNAEYKEGKLGNPARDANSIDERIVKLGFKSIKRIDVDRDGFFEALDEFDQLFSEVKVALLFYAGHGIQFEHKNYMLPINTHLRRSQDVKKCGVEVDEVMSFLEDRSESLLVFLDCCRNNPFIETLVASANASKRELVVRPGLSEIRKSGSVKGKLIAFATQPNDTADDGSGEHSPYAQAILNHIDKPNQSISDMLIDVRNDVLKATNNRQVPWEHSSLRKKFVFNEADDPKNISSDKASDEEDWLSIQASNSIYVFEQFIKSHPLSKLSKYARARVDEIRADSSQAQRNTRLSWKPAGHDVSGVKKALDRQIASRRKKPFGMDNMLDPDMLKHLINISVFSTARIIAKDGRGVGSAFVVRGSDFNVARDGLYILTAAHVVGTRGDRRASFAPQDVLISFDGLIGEGHIDRPLSVGNVIWESGVDDYDAILLDIAEGTPKDLLPIDIARDLPEFDPNSSLDRSNRPIVISISYPYGGPIRFGNVNNYLLDYERPLFDVAGRPVDRPIILHYTAASEPGSSGCPILNGDLQVIAMHRGASDQARRLNGISGTYAANFGIWIQSIIQEAGHM